MPPPTATPKPPGLRRSRARARIGAGNALALIAVTVLAACAGTDNAAFDSAYHDGRAAEVTVRATVTSLLVDSPPHTDGPHQRFDVIVDGIPVEIDHNISLAPRVPVHTGDTVTIHGQYEPDPGHPVIHYTHHATGSHEGGWIILGGTTYQ